MPQTLGLLTEPFLRAQPCWEGAQHPPVPRAGPGLTGERGPAAAVEGPGAWERGGAACPREMQIRDNQPPRQQSEM